MDAGSEDRVQIALGEVRPCIADLVGAPAVTERPGNLTGRADVETDHGQRSRRNASRSGSR
jgi:hypothetical protein